MEFNKIYCGDCYELIKQVKDKSVDLVIIDPPYEFVMGGNGYSDICKRKTKSADEICSLDTDLTKEKYQSGGGCFGTKKRTYHSELAPTDVDKETAKFISKGITNDILDELCRVMKKINIYVWCSKNQLRQLIDYFDDKGCFVDLLTWNKTNPIPTCNNTYLSDIEYCVFARERGVPIYGTVATKSKWWTTPCNTDDKKLYKHPTIKPLERIKHFIINSSVEGGVVLDCFLGSGTTCVAAKELNRQYIGFELNPTFYQIALDRINGIDQKGQMSLLDTDFNQLDLFEDNNNE
jgi:DNA modification methylase